MNTEQLVKMANDVAVFFSAEEDADVAAEAVADHLKRFWEPRMRKSIVDFQKAGGYGMTEVVQKAVQRLAACSR